MAKATATTTTIKHYLCAVVVVVVPSLSLLPTYFAGYNDRIINEVVVLSV